MFFNGGGARVMAVRVSPTCCRNAAVIAELRIGTRLEQPSHNR
jgi:hypothetical protein